MAAVTKTTAAESSPAASSRFSTTIPPAEKLRDQIPAGADDLSIRVPRPAFKLPSPPAKR